MNKIYKVIWSKVKHQYVVTSEFAHSCTKSTTSRAGRSAAAVLAALILTTGICAVPAQAADPTLEELYYEQLNSTVHNDETSSPVVKLVEAPTAAPTAAKDGEQAVDNDMQTGEDGGMTGAADQYTVVNEDGFYASNTKGTHNTLSKDGLWVGGTDDNTGFHVDNDGNVRTTGRVTANAVTATTVTGGTVIGETIQNANGSFSVDANGNVDTETVKSEGMSVVDEDGNTTFQVLSNGDVTAHAVTATTVTGGTIQNADGSFSVDANGNVDAETVKSEGMSVVDEDGNTTFQVLSNGDVTAHDVTANTVDANAVTATTVTGGTVIGETIQNTNGSFRVDANGNVDAETVKSEGMSVVDENGDTTFQVLANGKVTATEAQIDNVTIGGTDDSTAINVSDGKFVVYDGGAFQAAGRNFIVNGQGEMTAAAATVDNVVINDDKVTGLSNTIWTGNKGDVVSGRAATEDQLMTVQTDVTTLENKTAHIEHVTEPEGTDYTTVEGTKFDSDGSISAVAKDNLGFGTASLDFNADGVSIKEESFGATSSTTISGDKITATDASDNQTIIDGGSVTTEQLTVSGNPDNKLTFGERGLNINSGDTNVNVSKDGISLNVDNREGLNNSVKISQDSTTFSYSESGAAGATTTVIKGNTITAGDVVIDGAAGKATITGLSNTEWSGKVEDLVADRAATEGQLMTIYDNVRHIKHVGVDGTHYTLVEKTKFNDDGSVETMGTVKAADATFEEGSHELVTAGQLYAAGIVPGKVESKDGTPVVKSIALGEGSKAIASQATALGSNSSATAAATAVGEEAKATGIHSTALGYQSMATKESATALGYHAQALHDNSIALGANSITDRENSISVGRVDAERQITNVAAGTERTDAANVGQLEDFQVQVGETIGTADFSRTNYARGAEDVTEAIYDVDRQVKVNSDALDAYEAAGIVAGNEVGQDSHAIALGNNATADGWSAVAIGSNAEAKGSNSVAIGVDSASGALSTAVGAGSTAEGPQATALGQYSNALGKGAVSLGANSEAVGEGAVSIGFNNSAEVAGSVAIGNGAHVYKGGTNSVALGQWSTTSDDKVVSVGNDWLKRRITNVAAGTAVTDAVNKGQLDDAVDGVVKWDSDGDGGYETGHLTSVTEFEANNQVGESITLNEKDGLILRSSGAQSNSTISMNDGTLSLRNGNAENTTFVDVTTNGTTFSQLTDNSKTTISGGNIVTDSVTGLDNTEWNGKTNNESRAATEGQLADLNEVVEDNAKGVVKWDNLDEEAGQIKGVTFAGYGNLEVSDLKFDTLSNKEDTFSVDADGSVSALNGQFVVNEDGMTVTGEDGGSFAINAAGEIAAATAADAASGYVYSFNMNNTEGITLGAEEATMTINDRGATFRGDTTDATTNINADEITTGTVLANSNMYIGTVDDGNAVVTQDQLTDTVGNATDGMVTWDQDPVDHTYQEGSLSSVTNLNVTGNATLQNSNNIFDSEYIALSDNPESRQLQLGSYVTGANDDITLGQITLENGTINMSAGSLSEPSNITEIYVNSDGLTVSTLGNDELGGTDKTTIDGGRITTGTINAASGNFVVYSDGSVESQSKIGAINGEFSNLLHATVGRFDTLQVGERNDDNFAFYVASDGSVDAANGTFRVYSDGGVRTPWVTGLSNTTWTPDTVDYEGSANAATEAQLAVVDSKAQGNTDVLAEYEDAGIIAGSVDGEAEGAIAIGEGAAAINGNSIPNGAIAIGHEATVSMNGAVAIGDGANAVGQNSVALGTGASTTNGGWNSVAIGWGSQATDSNVVSVGSDEYKRRIVNVADGTFAHDAATVGQIADVLGLEDPNGKGLQIASGPEGYTFKNGAESVVEGINKNSESINKNSESIESLQRGQSDIWSSLDTRNQNLETMMSKASTFAAVTSNVDWKALNSMDWNSLNAVSQISTMSLDVAPTNTIMAVSSQVRDPKPGDSNESGNPSGDGSTDIPGLKVDADQISTDRDFSVGGDLSVSGETNLGGSLTVEGDSTFKGDATFEKGASMNGTLNMNGNKITGVKDGDISASSTDAVNGSQLYQVQQDVANNSTAISTLGHKVGELDNRIDEVGAGAAALAALHPLDFDPDNKWDFSAGYGNYRGESAVAFGAFYRPNEDTMFSVGGTVGNDDNMVNAGVSIKIGSGSSGVTTSRVAMAKEIKAMRDVVAKQDAQIQKLTAMVNALVGIQSEPDTTTMFPDVPENHWAYEAVAAMARSGLVKGYPDGEFKGDRTMTRYEFAQIIQNAIQAGAEVDSRLVEEFKPELEYFHIATVAKDKDGNPTIERVRAN